MSAADFTLAGYRAMIVGLFGRGYTVVGYREADPGARHLILRHDLDMSIQAAVPIAEAEAALGAKGHYFVLLSTEMYNPWSAASRRDLHRIGALGHEIGLHFDASLHPDDDAGLDRAAADECAALAALVGRPVETVSFHRPARRLLGRTAPLAGRRHTYQPRYFAEMGYCSDSRGGWHHGRPEAHVAVAEGRALQLLTHPIWWSRGEPLDPVAALDGFRVERDAALARALAANCEPYRAARGETPAAMKEIPNDD